MIWKTTTFSISDKIMTFFSQKQNLTLLSLSVTIYMGSLETECYGLRTHIYIKNIYKSASLLKVQIKNTAFCMLSKNIFKLFIKYIVSITTKSFYVLSTDIDCFLLGFSTKTYVLEYLLPQRHKEYNSFKDNDMSQMVNIIFWPELLEALMALERPLYCNIGQLFVPSIIYLPCSRGGSWSAYPPMTVPS